MEKFAVDLDKVLDDFEFNEDCAEQVASESISRPWPSTDLSDPRKTEHNNTEPKNPIYSHTDETKSDKIGSRENDSPVMSDQSQKYLQKKADGQLSKNQNSYDKKLNQPNIKPSVSNVFNSLNEYINASTASLEATSYSLDISRERNCRLGSNSSDSNGGATRALPTYQNILLPVKVEPCGTHIGPDKEGKEVETSGTSGSLETSGSSGVSYIEKNFAGRQKDCSDHIYENVEFGKSTSRTPRAPEPSRASSQDETKHIYENVDFNSTTLKSEGSVYECIYLGRKDLPETTTELEKAAKRLTEQFPEYGGIDKSVREKESPVRESIVFENVNLNVSNVSTERKAVGFSTIDDLSEEELTKYLAELEAEERANEAVMYENMSVPGPSYQNCAISTSASKEPTRIVSDEDANEAPIFESVMIGELPRVSDEKIQEKSKKLRVIDYSRSGTSVEPAGFLEKPTTEELEEKNYSDAKGIGEDRGVGEGLGEGKLSRGSSIVDVSDDSSSEEEENDVKDCSDMVEHLNEKERLGPEGENPEDAKIESVTENGSREEPGIDEAGEKTMRPQTLDIVSSVSSVSMDEVSIPATPDAGDVATTVEPSSPDRDGSLEESQDHREPSPDASDNSSMEFGIILGKQPPFWIPDSDAPNCMLCDVKFNVIKRRHHCRACGKVLCNKCCSMKYRLEYQGNMDSRVCALCYQQLIRAENDPGGGEWSSGFPNNVDSGINSPQGRQPNPNNPMEYCSTIPPLQQLAGNLPPPPTVMVPVGVLKREGSTKQRTEGQKSVMFSDGIRPGCDLTELDTSWNLKPPYRKSSNKRISSPGQQTTTKRQNLPPLDPHTNSYIPGETNVLPPTVTIHKGQISYQEVLDSAALYELLKNESEPPVMFAINRNLYAYVKMTNLNCCVNKQCWNVTSRGLACVGQDEVILLVEALPDETQIPKDLLTHINQIYVEAVKGNTVTELGVSIHQDGTLLGSREHAGFLFIRQTFQCLQKIVLPPPPFLVGLLVHRWETPWAKIFPLRLVLRLGAEYRYYPCPLVSVRFRNAVYFEIGHTIMKVLADFRNYAYTLPGVRGMVIHMQDRTTDVSFPRNRYDQVIKGLNNSNDHVLAFAANFSIHVDSHLVCIQTNTGDESTYQTQAINIHNKPRKVTGASFVVINGALKSSMGLSAKSSIVEDGLMVQIMPEKMEALKAALKNMQDFAIDCGRQGAPEPDETVNIKWVDNDVGFNQGLKSPIDGKPMDGIPSIRVHNGNDYMGTSRFIRWTEVFIIKSDDHPNGVHDPVDLNKLSENIARATCAALVKLLDLLAAAGLTKLAVRATIHPDNVGYEAGSEGTRLPPIYMNSLDNELIQVLHKAAQNSQDTNTVLELIFHVLDD